MGRKSGELIIVYTYSKVSYYAFTGFPSLLRLLLLLVKSLVYAQATCPIQIIQLCHLFIFFINLSISRNAIPERLIEKIKERSDSLFSLSGLSPRLGRKRGSSGPSTIEPQGSRKLVVLGPSQVGKSSICATYALSLIHI